MVEDYDFLLKLKRFGYREGRMRWLKGSEVFAKDGNQV